jgi:hypothetical protein
LPRAVTIASESNTTFWREMGPIRQKYVVIAEKIKPHINASLFEGLITPELYDILTIPVDIQLPVDGELSH